ncbi:hypothetical protein [Natronobacterium texcoconense]|uniref:Right handed beta helix region n=1 Tax=Natronobacterium texcoconense TaxID=1095778 RepID=A0A1H1F766_NATTX|nr:hypothetical protein [Natronobacterium texcoconense]SDQ96649.1 hypothetical protein SAMN04489842_1845 [Natronobacterium texcoconense]
MARDPKKLDDGRHDDRGAESDDTPGNNTLIDRRSYLKAAGVTSMVGAGLAAGAGSAAASEDYDVIEVGPGEFWQHRLSEGETFENVLIDITARGAQAKIWATGISDFEIRNVGWLGRWDTRERHAFIHAACSGHGVIENVYMGDGAASTNYPNSPTGVFVNRRHSGHIDINNLHVQHVADNAVYASEPTRTGGGTVDIRNSYARDMQPAAWRVPGGSTVENCVAINCHRGVWVRYGEIDVIDCDLQGNRVGDMVAHASGIGGHAPPVINAQNTAWRTDVVQSNGAINGSSVGSARRTQPEEVEGVPLSAEEAASGQSGDSDPNPPSDPGNGDDGDDDGQDDPDIEDVWNDDESNHLVLEDRSSGVSEYQLTGHGNAETGDDADTGSDDPYRDTVTTDGDEFVVEGYLGGYRDDFHVEGRIDSVSADSDVVAVVNGETFDVAELEGVGSWDSDDDDEDDSGIEDVWNDDEPNHLVFEDDSSGVSEYQLTGQGNAETGDDADTGSDDPYRDTVSTDGDEFVIEGYLGGYRDDFYVEGRIDSVTADSDVTAVVNGEPFDPAELEGVGSWDGDDDDDEDDAPAELPHVLEFDGSETSEPTSYSFTVEGDVARAASDDSVHDDDVIDGSTVRGVVGDGRDTYRFSGDITDFRLVGKAAVNLEYNVAE